jgi:hypothetical protein
VPLAELMTYVARGKTACRDFHQSTVVITTTSFIISLIKFKTLLLVKALSAHFHSVNKRIALYTSSENG